jgi:hypothetical protein
MRLPGSGVGISFHSQFDAAVTGRQRDFNRGETMPLRVPRVIGTVCLCGLIWPVPIHAQALDQNYDPGSNPVLTAGFASSLTNQERAQTFTVGLTGDLTRIDVFIQRNSGSVGNLFADIRTVDASDHPIAGNLRTLTIPAANVPTFPDPVGFFTLDFSANPLPIQSGNHFAVVLHCSAGDVAMLWLGSNANPYPGGHGQEQQIGSHGWFHELNGNEDLGFRTFVAVPEPTATAPALIILAATLLRRWRN